MTMDFFGWWPRRSGAVCLLAGAVSGALVQAAQPAQPAQSVQPVQPAQRVPAANPGVNPLTGVPLSLELARWTLEQSRLEEQLQASLLNRRKLESERLRLESGAMPPAALSAPELSPGTGVTSASSAGAAPRSGSVPPTRRRTARTMPARLLPDSALIQRARTGPVPLIVGVRQMRGQWCVLLEEPAGMSSVCPGQSIQGQALQAVSAQGYQLGGIQHALEVGPILLAPQHVPVPAPAPAPALTSALAPELAPVSAAASAPISAFAPAAELALGTPGAVVGAFADRP